jgi:hypothetical protein
MKHKVVLEIDMGDGNVEGVTVEEANDIINLGTFVDVKVVDLFTPTHAAAPEMLEELKEILSFAVTEKTKLRETEICSIRSLVNRIEGGE